MESRSKVGWCTAVGTLVCAAILVVGTSSTGSASGTTTTTTTTVPSSTTTVPKTTPAATASTKSNGHYEVVAGIFTTKAKAQAQVDALKAAKFAKFKIKNISPKFAVVRINLTKAQATKLAKRVTATKGLGKARIKKIS